MVRREIGRNSFLNPGQQFWNLALEKAVPAPKLIHLEGSQFIFRVEGQNVGNHNNVGPFSSDAMNIGNVGSSVFQYVPNARETAGL